jgi:3-methyladenine DNA glycosylase AlkD
MPQRPKSVSSSVNSEVVRALDSLKRHGSKAGRDGMARYGLPSDRAYGVAMRDVQTLAKRLGKNHDLAAALWTSGWYEAQLLAAYVDDPAQLTPAQMDRWCRDFDSWGLCDTVCFVLFDKTPHAWTMVKRWAGRRGEFTRRAAFALLWGLSVHDKTAADSAFVACLVLIERAADDDRHFVKKGVNMALRAIGKRNRSLHAAAVKIATRLADSSRKSARWVGKDALRELTSSSVTRRMARRS